MSLAHVAWSATKFAVKVAKSKFVGISWIDSLSTIVAEPTLHFHVTVQSPVGKNELLTCKLK